MTATPTANCPRCTALRREASARRRAELPSEKPQFGHRWWPMCSAECARADKEHTRGHGERRALRLARAGLSLEALPADALLPASPSPQPGAYTHDKQIYDRLAAEFFRQRGWQASVIDKRGRVVDVLAVRGSELAMLEVKSQRERSSSKSWSGDWQGLSPALEASHGGYFRTARERIWSLLPARAPFVRVYAIAIVCQLYRYFIEFEEVAHQYEPWLGLRLQGEQFVKRPFLVVPVEREGDLRTALKILSAGGFILSPGVETTAPLAVASFSYPHR